MKIIGCLRRVSDFAFHFRPTFKQPPRYWYSGGNWSRSQRLILMKLDGTRAPVYLTNYCFLQMGGGVDNTKRDQGREGLRRTDGVP